MTTSAFALVLSFCRWPCAARRAAFMSLMSLVLVSISDLREESSALTASIFVFSLSARVALVALAFWVFACSDWHQLSRRASCACCSFSLDSISWIKAFTFLKTSLDVLPEPSWACSSKAASPGLAADSKRRAIFRRLSSCDVWCKLPASEDSCKKLVAPAVLLVSSVKACVTTPVSVVREALRALKSLFLSLRSISSCVSCCVVEESRLLTESKSLFALPPASSEVEMADLSSSTAAWRAFASACNVLVSSAKFLRDFSSAAWVAVSSVSVSVLTCFSVSDRSPIAGAESSESKLSSPKAESLSDP
mmetsp:Transcript_19696/g.45849  ORF Transcript_19696/g.45849 Transcript_19696/m.45849 type:complete len:307 (+) Transcript_19696:515-1435(+)